MKIVSPEKIVEAFEDWWKNKAPVFPDPEEHERHRIVARSAWLSAYLWAIKMQPEEDLIRI
jgi:hypothetical protein